MPPRQAAASGARGAAGRGRGRGRGQGRGRGARGGASGRGRGQPKGQPISSDDDDDEADDDVAMPDADDSDDSEFSGDDDDDDDADDDESEAEASDASFDDDTPRRGPARARGARKAAPNAASNAARRTSRASATATAAEDEPAVDVHRIPTFAEAERVVRTTRGPYRRGDTPKHIARAIYGSGTPLFQAICERWAATLPAVDPDEPDAGVLASPWLREHFEDEQIDAMRQWFGVHGVVPPARVAGQGYLPYDYDADADADADADSRLYIVAGDNVVAVSPGAAVQLPANDDPDVLRAVVAELGGDAAAVDAQGADYALHAGGDIAALAWAPVGLPDVPQLLAVAASPHHASAETDVTEADVVETDVAEIDVAEAEGDATLDPQLQVAEDIDLEADDEAEWSAASIQLWTVQPGHAPVLATVLCFDWGWPRRLAWCPVPLVHGPDEAALQGVYGLLGVLADDGVVRVIQGGVPDQATTFVQPHVVATLAIAGDPGAKATCFAWTGVAEMAVGHADGTLTLWSFADADSDATMLLRLALHDDSVLDVCVAYPSHPHLVASRPVHGVVRLTDLRRPAADHTYHPTPTVAFQPHLLAWSDHMQGFASTAAINNPVNGRLDFFPAAFFACPLFFMPHARASLPTCMAVGAVHPYAAVGRSDGSVAVVNMVDSIDRAGRKQRARPPPAYVLRSEWRALEAVADAADAADGGSESETNKKKEPATGAVALRTLSTVSYQGVPIGLSDMGRTVAAGADDTMFDDDDDDDTADAADAADATTGPSSMTIYDHRTRVAAIAWNPNLGHGTWCAIGLGSGLVVVKSLAINNV